MGKLRYSLMLAVAALAALTMSACGGGGGGGGAGKAGGSIKIGSVLPDSYDPVLFKTVQANQPLQLVYKGLVTYKDAEGTSGNTLNAGISGITSNDNTGQITVKLSAPDSQFLFAAGLANAAPTPAAKSPFKKSNTIPGAGPYKIKVVNPTREFILTKNPSFHVSGID